MPIPLFIIDFPAILASTKLYTGDLDHLTAAYELARNSHEARFRFSNVRNVFRPEWMPGILRDLLICHLEPLIMNL